MIKPSKGRAKLISSNKISSKVLWATFEVMEPNGFSFEPGQFISTIINGNTVRQYSICSDVKKLPLFSLAIETSHEGIGSNYFNTLKLGEEVSFLGPLGKLSFPANLLEIPIKNLYFIATGTGIAPFMSMLYKLAEVKYTGNVKLLFGVRHETEMIFTEELDNFKKEIPNFNYTVCISQPEKPENRPQRVTSVLPDLNDSSAIYFLCGHPLMVDEVQKGLLENKIPQENIIKEEFTRGVS